MKKVLIILASFVMLISSTLLGNQKKPYEIAEVFTEMRDMAFNVKPAELKIKQKSSGQIYGIIMETGYDDAVFSLRCFGEGSISIYFSNGAGMIGIGEHANARAKGLELIDFSMNYKSKARKTTKRDLPLPGYTYFYLLAFDGIYVIESKTSELEKEDNNVYALYVKAHDVITEARLIEEKRNK